MNGRACDAALRPAMLLAAPREDRFSDRNRLWQGIPSIEVTPAGRLWVAFYGGGSREGRGNHVLLVRRDVGAAWGEVELVAVHDDPAVRTFDPCLWIDPCGRLWFCWAQSWELYDGRLGVWASMLTDPDASSPTWTAPRRLADGVMLNKPTVLSTGEWLFPIALWACDEPVIDNGLGAEMLSHVYVSRDAGGSLTRLGSADVPHRHYDEHMLVELRDGRLWMLVRTRYGIGQSFSSDGGRHWSPGEPTELGGPSARFHIRRLRSGRLLLVNHRDFTARDHLTALLSEDEGTCWRGGLLLDPRPSVSYPDACQGADGLLHVVYDRERGREREILLAEITEEDILAGRCVSPRASLGTLVNKGARTA